MNKLARSTEYLKIPREYGAALGGLWWTSRHDAVERGDGTTLAVIDEIRVVLEGVAARPPLAPFAFVLNLLHLLKAGGAGFERLRQAFADTRGSATRGRNAGLLVAELCRGLPFEAGTVGGADVKLALQSLRLRGELDTPGGVAEPPLTRVEFEDRIRARLASFGDGALAHWLAYGCGPDESGGQLAEQTESLPERASRLLADARQRARLVGAAALVPALDAALSLPPRVRSPDRLPQGGYCDVTTRGAPERLLPGQFALDPDDFVRRFAGNELLYFKREEPHKAVRPDRIVALDQGVRTWGGVRLALTAAALSLIRVDVKRTGSVRLFATSTPESVDLMGPNRDAVAERLEASDLTPHPGGCLARALQRDRGDRAPRDVILLTHPRALREPAVQQAAAARGPEDRLFTVSVDEGGRAELSEWARGGPQVVRSFRVDLAAGEAARPEHASSATAATTRSAALWAGSVEPVPFPFRPGLVAEPLSFGFDGDGEWLVAAGKNGVLHGLTLDGNSPEVLPRPFRNGSVMRHVDAILSVSGGVVVCGRMAAAPGAHDTPDPIASVVLHSHDVPVVSSGATRTAAAEQYVAAHYDRTLRRVTLHTFGPVRGEPRWSAHPELHCVSLRTATGTGQALDLATQGRFPAADRTAPALTSRACLAWDRSAKNAPSHDVPIVSELPPDHSGLWDSPFLTRLSAGTLDLRQAPRAWHAMTPCRDGQQRLAGGELHRAQLAGDVLAVSYSNAGERELIFFRGPEGAVLGEVAHPIRHPFALSPDGRLVAHRDATRAVAVRETSAPAVTVVSATHAGLHDSLAVGLAAEPFCLTITVGGHRHAFRVLGGALQYQVRWELPERAEKPKGGSPHPPTGYDPARFPKDLIASEGRWRAVVDRFGQVLLYRGNGSGPPVAAFLIRRERAAAWVPDGVFWGDSRLIGGPPTPDAEHRIGRAILGAGGN